MIESRRMVNCKLASAVIFGLKVCVVVYLSLMERTDMINVMEDCLDLQSQKLVMEIKWR